jgi:hypothetical protein
MVQARWWWVSSSYINMAASPSSTIAHVQTKFKNALIEFSTCQFAWYLHSTATILAQIVMAWFMQWNGNAGITRQRTCHGVQSIITHIHTHTRTHTYTHTLLMLTVQWRNTMCISQG